MDTDKIGARAYDPGDKMNRGLLRLAELRSGKSVFIRVHPWLGKPLRHALRC
jgi:hypothetical protein